MKTINPENIAKHRKVKKVLGNI